VFSPREDEEHLRMLDDLRRSTLESDSTQDEFDFDDLPVEAKPERRRFLGLSPVERMFLMIFFFMNVVVIGLVLLLATGRLVL
jgi:hypothetical protein